MSVEEYVNITVYCSNVALTNCTKSITDSSSLRVDHRQAVPLVVKERKKGRRRERKTLE